MSSWRGQGRGWRPSRRARGGYRGGGGFSYRPSHRMPSYRPSYAASYRGTFGYRPRPPSTFHSTFSSRYGQDTTYAAQTRQVSRSAEETPPVDRLLRRIHSVERLLQSYQTQTGLDSPPQDTEASVKAYDAPSPSAKELADACPEHSKASDQQRGQSCHAQFALSQPEPQQSPPVLRRPSSAGHSLGHYDSAKDGTGTGHPLRPTSAPPAIQPADVLRHRHRYSEGATTSDAGRQARSTPPSSADSMSASGRHWSDSSTVSVVRGGTPCINAKNPALRRLPLIHIPLDELETGGVAFAPLQTLQPNSIKGAAPAQTLPLSAETFPAPSAVEVEQSPAVDASNRTLCQQPPAPPAFCQPPPASSSHSHQPAEAAQDAPLSRPMDARGRLDTMMRSAMSPRLLSRIDGFFQGAVGPSVYRAVAARCRVEADEQPGSSQDNPVHVDSGSPSPEQDIILQRLPPEPDERSFQYESSLKERLQRARLARASANVSTPSPSTPRQSKSPRPCRVRLAPSRVESGQSDTLPLWCIDTEPSDVLHAEDDGDLTRSDACESEWSEDSTSDEESDSEDDSDDGAESSGGDVSHAEDAADRLPPLQTSGEARRTLFKGVVYAKDQRGAYFQCGVISRLKPGKRHPRPPNKRERALALRRDYHGGYCLAFNKTGSCRRKGCLLKHDLSRVRACSHFLMGECTRPCPLSHTDDPAKVPHCEYFARGRCVRDSCPFVHVKLPPDAPICKDFVFGHCPSGRDCQQRHQMICLVAAAGQRCPVGARCPLSHPRAPKKRKRPPSGSAQPPQSSGLKVASSTAADDETAPATFRSTVDSSEPRRIFAEAFKANGDTSAGEPKRRKTRCGRRKKKSNTSELATVSSQTASTEVATPSRGLLTGLSLDDSIVSSATPGLERLAPLRQPRK